MLPFYRFIEISVYSLLNLLPFLLLALYPFRNNLRFRPAVIHLLIIAIAIIQIALGISATCLSSGHTAMLTIISTILYATFYFTAVKMPLGKTLFTLLMLSNTANFVVVASKCIEGQLFPQLALQSYRWSMSFIMLLIELIVLVPLFFYIKNAFTPVMENRTSEYQWKFLWLIPTVFYLVWYYGIYGIKGRSALEVALRPQNTLFLLFVNLGAFLVYYVVAKLVTEQEKSTQLEKKNHQLELQALQYSNIQEKIIEAQRAKHDVRHHIALMQEYLNNNRYEELNEYMKSYNKSTPDHSLINYCRNTSVNSLLSYFSQQAEKYNIEYIVKVDIPDKIKISETDISVMLGNLLENSIDACASKDGNSKIIVRAKADNSTLCLTVDNTFKGSLEQNSDGTIISTKHEGPGIGLKSVRSIVDTYNGTMKIEQQDEMLCISLLLNL